MHILDTDTLTHLHSGRPNVVNNLKKLDDPDVTNWLSRTGWIEEESTTKKPMMSFNKQHGG